MVPPPPCGSEGEKRSPSANLVVLGARVCMYVCAAANQLIKSRLDS